MEKQQIVLVGGGTMGEAIVRGLLREDLVQADSVTVCDPVAERRDFLSSELGVRVTDDNADAVPGASIVILAVKPQVLDDVMAGLNGTVGSATLIVSIVAGATIRAIGMGLGTRAIVRVMPNTPGQIGEGISVWTATPDVTDEQRKLAGSIVGALGQQVYVDREGYLDMATALSGSGPAYVFLFIEALTDAGVQMGFPRPVAAKLALQTVKGSAVYAQDSGEHPAVLRNRVTSPGGTTAEALYAFEQGGLRATVTRAVLAAYEKAKSFGDTEN